MKLSIRKLHSNGDVTIELGYSAARDVLDNVSDYNDTFTANLQTAWDQHPWGSYEIRIDAASASAMANNGEIEAEPSGRTSGYPHAYVGDGFLLCPACVLKQVQENGDDHGVDSEQMRCELFVYQETPSSGDTCDQCSQYIPGAEPHCGDCGDTEGDVTTYADGETYTVVLESNISGDQRLCRRCIAKQLISREAELVGVHAYKVGCDTYGDGAYAATR